MSAGHTGGLHEPVQTPANSFISFCLPRGKKKCKRILPPLPSRKALLSAGEKGLSCRFIHILDNEAKKQYNLCRSLRRKEKNNMGILIRNTSNYSAGEIIYYISKKRMFGCVILFQQQDYYLIALSEEITKTTKDICCNDVLQSALYTLAWFSDVEMLLPHRLHRLVTIPLTADYTNRAGLLIDDQGLTLKNVGQRGTWTHTFRSFALRDVKVKDVLDTKYVPKTIR